MNYEEVLREAVQRIVEHDPAKVRAAAEGVQIASPPENADMRGRALAHMWPMIRLGQRFRDASGHDLFAALRAEDPSVTFAALPILATIEPSQAQVRLETWAKELARGGSFHEAGRGDDPYDRIFELGVGAAGRALLAILPTLPIEALAGPLGDVGGSEAIEAAVKSRREVRSAEGALALLERLVDAPPRSGWLERLLVARFVAAKDDRVVPPLRRALANPSHPRRKQLTWALNDLGTDAAREALADALDRSKPLPREYGEIANAESHMLDAYLRRELRRPLDEVVARFLAPAAITTPDGKDIAVRVLDRLAVDENGKSDPRLDDACAALLDAPAIVRWKARDVLSKAGKARALAALERAGRAPTKKTKSSAVATTKKNRLARYRKGEHVAVWDELHAIDLEAADAEVRAEVEAVAEETVKRVRQNVERIVAVLRAGGYGFARKQPLGKAPKDAVKKLAALEKTTKASVPLLVRALYLASDTIDLSEATEHAYDDGNPFETFGQRDPLVIAPLAKTTAWIKQEAMQSKRFLPELRDPPQLYLSPDPQTIYDPDHAMPDEAPRLVALGRLSADGRVTIPFDDREPQWLVDHLRRAIAAGGFFGLSAEQRRTRPEWSKLTADIVPF